MEDDNQINIGVSSCLLGEKVRFDGQAKYHWYINEILKEHFNYLPICPEVAIGMGIPRPTVRLEGELKNPAMIDPKSRQDWSQKMRAYSIKTTNKLSHLHGYIFKKGSPSCGVFRVKVYQKNGIPLPNGQGLFAAEFTKKYPLIPVEEEGRLNDPKLRENFIERVFGYHRLCNQMEAKFSRKSWIEFHTNNKYLLMSHSPKHYRQAGQLVAKIKDHTPSAFKEAYAQLFMETLAVKTTVRKNADVLYHILGFLKKLVASGEKESLLKTIQDYHAGVVPLIVPITLLKHYVDLKQVDFVKDQTYLNPHPANLSLRNHC